jgi:phosphonate transport system substrate-binding protein
MFKKTTPLSLIATLLVLLISACSPQINSTPVPVATIPPTLAKSQVITLGLISNDPAGGIQEAQPLADYLAAQLKDQGISAGKVVIAPDLQAMEKAMQAGQVDLFFESPYLASAVFHDINAIPLARRWKGGVSEYYSLIVTRADGPIDSIEKLIGHQIAFEDPGSTSGYLLPKADMLSKGLKLTEKNGSDSSVAPDEVGYIFSGAQENLLPWLLSGKVEATVLANNDYDALPKDEQARLRILDKSIAVPRHIVMARAGIDPQLQQKIIQLLVSMDKTPEGQAVLQAFAKTQRFDLLTPDPSQVLQQLYDLFSRAS